jgi:arsenite methyltransferase
MQDPYQDAKRIWDGIYGQALDSPDKFDPNKMLTPRILERSLEWMLDNQRKTVMDFGCGSGRVLYRCLAYGAEHVIGIDLSQKGIGLARMRANRFSREYKMTLIIGGVEKLEKVRKVIDGAILFNIIDNLLPRDAHRVVDDITRKMRAGGRVLLKMSDYFERKKLVEEDQAVEIGPNAYRERTGLFFLNLTDEEIESLFGRFKVCRKLRIKFSQGRFWNRLWHFEKTS